MIKKIQEDIEKAIRLIIDTDIEYDKIIELFIDNEIDHEIVEDLFLFLPIVFCRNMLPQVYFPNTFIEKKNNQEIRKKFETVSIYKQIQKVVNKSFHSLSGNEIIKIAGLSAEFKIINNLLINETENHENLLKEIKLTEMIINR